LREDFVEMGCPSNADEKVGNEYLCGTSGAEKIDALRYLDLKTSKYQQKKLKLFS
jgi:hypothetical protein